jgi:hypothetical protein
MTIIERVGHVNVVQHGQAFLVIGRDGQGIDTYTSPRDARERAFERADLVDGLAAITTRH